MVRAPAWSNGDMIDEKTIRQVFMKAKPDFSKAQAVWYGSIVNTIAQEMKRRPDLSPRFFVSKRFVKALKAAFETAAATRVDDVAQPSETSSGRAVGRRRKQDPVSST